MALTNFLTLYSGLDTAKGGTSATETHRIPVSAPYAVLLSRIPRCSELSSSVIDNAFTTIAAFRAECSLTINGTPATIISGATPTASGEVAFQIIQGDQWRFSPKVTFHSSDAGKTAVFTYFGFMSNADSRYLDQIRNAVNRLEDLPPCAILSMNTHDGGAFLNGTADSTSVYVTGTRGAVDTGNGLLAFAGGALDLTADATQVSAFSDVDGYKSIAVYLQYISGALALRIAESAESATKPTTPTIADADGWLCGAVIVQGDGTGNAGGIETIAQSDCFSLWNMAGGGNSSSATVPVSFALWGALQAGEALDVMQVVPTNAVIQRVTVVLEESGSAGSTVIDIQTKASGGAWTSRYATTNDMPTIPYTAGDEAVVDSPGTDMTDAAMSAGTLIKAVCESVATGAANGRVTVWVV